MAAYGFFYIRKLKKERKKIMKNQDILRKQVKLAKACNDWLFYKDLAETLEISVNGFWNWLSGQYELSNPKARQLQDIVIDLIDYD